MPKGRKTPVGPTEFHCEECDQDIELGEGQVHCTAGSPHHNVHIDDMDTYDISVAVGGSYLTASGPKPYGRLKNGSRCLEHSREYHRHQSKKHYIPTGNPRGRPRPDGTNRLGDEKELNDLIEMWKEFVRLGANSDTLLLSKRAGKGIEMSEVLDPESRGVVYTNLEGRTYLWTPTKEEVPESAWNQTAIS